MRFLFRIWHNRFLRRVFRGIVSPAMLREISRGDWGHDREQSVEVSVLSVRFIIDSERHSANELFRFVNEALEAFSQAVFEEMGAIPNFSLEEMQACFGFPILRADDAVRACRCAMRLRALHEWLQEQWQEMGVRRRVLRIWIDRGPVSAGFIGWKARWKLGLIGVPVGRSSALGRASKRFGVHTVISEEVFSRIGDDFETRQLGRFLILGRVKPLTLYELTPEKTKVHRHYEAALGLYYDGRFAEARDAFRENPGDMPSGYMAQMCEDLLQNPPGGEWDGTHFLHSV